MSILNISALLHTAQHAIFRHVFKNVQIDTPRLILRPFTLDDIPAFHAILSQPEVMYYLPEGVMTLGEVREIVEWYQMCYEKDTPENIIKWTLAVWLKSDGTPEQTEAHPELIGWAGVGPLEFDESQIEIFYGLARHHWGRGYATEAARAVLDYAFGTIGIKRLVGIANPENAASVKVLEKIGMTFEKKLVGLPEKFANDEGSYFYCKPV
ncbi:MAG: GNAT family N-acetyltransferase [Candidatus Zixiibacteriota bacterium]|nr:MAG: GNAT family N-acetyltransferase [candidate division Zixibacteria bacterium]